MNERLRDRWVAITGASSGFGAAGAAAFAAAGARVLLGARRMAKLESVAADARRLGAPSAAFHALDVGDTRSVEAFAAWVRSQTDRVDVLINNAGGAHGLDPVATGQDADWEATIQSNVLGLLRVTRAILPLMGSRPGACILNIGSIAGHTAYAGGAVYCAAKSAERAITRALRMELCGTGIRVGTIDPGIAETEFSIVRFKGDAARAAKIYEGAEPLTAVDVAEAMVWAASRPPHVCIDEIVIKCTDQAEVYRIHRRTAPQGGPLV